MMHKYTHKISKRRKDILYLSNWDESWQIGQCCIVPFLPTATPEKYRAVFPPEQNDYIVHFPPRKADFLVVFPPLYSQDRNPTIYIPAI